MDKSELLKTAALAKLKLDENEVEKLALEVTAMLENFSAMMEADVDGLEATIQTLQQENRTRSDSPGSSNLSNELLKRVPVREDRFIVIPNVI
jgi:aspartyl-tRNA(Asn)/glutamyl-tRNA(Gln) amidotransferase subunit C